MEKVLGCATKAIAKSVNKNQLKTLKNKTLSRVIGSRVTAQQKPLDVSWLKSASSVYNISPDINDYVITAVPSVTSDLPNRRHQGMPKNELVAFQPHLGLLSYKTFIGKPTFVEHQHDDITKAKGVCFDSVMIFLPKQRLFKIIVLAGFDRTKDSYLANNIATNKQPFYSMGAWVDFFACSICGASTKKTSGIDTRCEHIKNLGLGKIFQQKLIFEKLFGITFFELSNVSSPADITAEGTLL